MEIFLATTDLSPHTFATPQELLPATGQHFQPKKFDVHNYRGLIRRRKRKDVQKRFGGSESKEVCRSVLRFCWPNTRLCTRNDPVA